VGLTSCASIAPGDELAEADIHLLGHLGAGKSQSIDADQEADGAIYLPPLGAPPTSCQLQNVSLVFKPQAPISEDPAVIRRPQTNASTAAEVVYSANGSSASFPDAFRLDVLRREFRVRVGSSAPSAAQLLSDADFAVFVADATCGVTARAPAPPGMVRDLEGGADNAAVLGAVPAGTPGGTALVIQVTVYYRFRAGSGEPYYSTYRRSLEAELRVEGAERFLVRSGLSTEDLGE
jgi:hypothetical protein